MVDVLRAAGPAGLSDAKEVSDPRGISQQPRLHGVDRNPQAERARTLAGKQVAHELGRAVGFVIEIRENEPGLEPRGLAVPTQSSPQAVLSLTAMERSDTSARVSDEASNDVPIGVSFAGADNPNGGAVVHAPKSAS